MCVQIFFYHQINTNCFISDSVSTDTALQHENRYLHAFKNNLIIINISFQIFTVGSFQITVFWVLAPRIFYKWILMLQSNRLPQYSRAEEFGPSLTLNCMSMWFGCIGWFQKCHQCFIYAPCCS
jgi:hypothetical protein